MLQHSCLFYLQRYIKLLNSGELGRQTAPVQRQGEETLQAHPALKRQSGESRNRWQTGMKERNYL